MNGDGAETWYYVIGPDRRRYGPLTLETLQEWRQSALQALADPGQARNASKQEREDRQRVQQLERELHRKDKALAETAALLVLSKKAEAIFNKGGDE